MQKTMEYKEMIKSLYTMYEKWHSGIKFVR